MKPFRCTHCANIVYFESDACVVCGMRLGYRPWKSDMVAVDVSGLTSKGEGSTGEPAFFCSNAQFNVCNWLVEPDSGQELCMACRHNLIVPDLSVPGNDEHWRKIEQAKRYVFYSLLRWGLPTPAPSTSPEGARVLSFSFEADVQKPDGKTEHVMTGHDSGHITINLAEADDAERERLRVEMGEPYRTLIGHFRHELGHFYWDLLIADKGKQEGFRAVFGDERQDYGEALKAHYASGGAGWTDNFVSSYASAHPWEDFAETWAHYIHMTDGLQTALSFGLDLSQSPLVEGDGDASRTDPYRETSARSLVDRWVPVSISLNSINRSMGQPDVYPFVLSAPVVEKLEYIHRLVRGLN